MKKKKRFPLTKSELALMEVLWDADRPLGRPEILDAALSNEGEPLFAVNSFHLLINDLIAKEYIVVVGGMGKDHNYARRYAPTVTRNEHFALQITSSPKFVPGDIPDIVCSLVKYSKVEDVEGMLEEIFKTVRRRMSPLGGKAADGKPEEPAE